MTILEPNQPWPQVWTKYWNGEFQCFMLKNEDKSIIDLILNAKELFLKNFYQPKTLFAGSRARNKIADLIAQREFLRMTTANKFFNGVLDDQKKFLDLDLVFTIDDGLWIA